MAGLVPAIHDLRCWAMRGGWVYIMTNRPNGTLYLGVEIYETPRCHGRACPGHPRLALLGHARRLGLYHDQSAERHALPRRGDIRNASMSWPGLSRPSTICVAWPC